MTLPSYASKLKYKCNGDMLLPAKMLFALDEEVQRWLENCMMAKDREEVDDSILEELSSIITDVLKGRFDVKLPKSFKLESTYSPNVDISSGPRSLKKQRLPDNANDNKLVNADPNEDYKLLDGENYKQIFCGKMCATG